MTTRSNIVWQSSQSLSCPSQCPPPCLGYYYLANQSTMLIWMQSNSTASSIYSTIKLMAGNLPETSWPILAEPTPVLLTPSFSPCCLGQLTNQPAMSIWKHLNAASAASLLSHTIYLQMTIFPRLLGQTSPLKQPLNQCTCPNNCALQQSQSNNPHSTWPCHGQAMLLVQL